MTPDSQLMATLFMCCAPFNLVGAEEPPGEVRASGSVPGVGCGSGLERFRRMFRSDRLEAVAHRAPDCRLVVALTPQVHGPGHVGLFF